MVVAPALSGARSPELPESTNDLAGAYSLANEAGGSTGVAGALGTAENALGFINQVSSLFKGGSGSAGGSAGALGEGMQPTDLPPTSSSGVMGTVPDSATGTGATADAGSSSLGTLGRVGGGISAAIGLYGAYEAGSQAKGIGGDLMAVGSGALAGAQLGTAILPGIGTVIGAIAGAVTGLAGVLFGDHGRSQAQHYDIVTVRPALQKEMWSFGGGQTGYDQASLDLNNMQIQAQQQTKSWGSGAVSYYNHNIVPEIQAMQAQIDRENKAGRANVKMSAAQFDSGGDITNFGDMATGPFSGFIHARLGEKVMNPMASMVHSSTLDAMNVWAVHS